jgi:hypothetical protein
MAAAPQPDEAESDDQLGSAEPSPTRAMGTGTSRRLPTAAVASSAVADDPVIGARLARPAGAGARRRAVPADAGEAHREPPAAWEPIVMASGRQKSERAPQPSRLEVEPRTEATPATGGPRHRHPDRRAGDAARDLLADKAAARASAAPPRREEPAAAEMPGLYTFRPRRMVRRVLTVAMLVAMAACAYVVRAALESKDTAGIGLAAIVVLATAMLWAIRAGASVTTLVLRQGQLEIRQQGSRFKLDIASPYTLIEVRGEPGRRGWQVVFPRRGLEPFVVDASMVDPHDFMRVLRFFRPG